MNVKNLLKSAMVAILVSITVPAISDPVTTTTGPVKEANAPSQPMLQRLQEIKNMDKSNLTKTERKDLRSELKTMRKQARGSNGIYLSVGAIIIAILLLILLLR